jgi:Zn-dependent peptidase ImmA (M78 family)
MKDEKKEEFKLHLAELYNYLKNELKLKGSPKLFLMSDQKNADKILGKTGYYDPAKSEIHLFITDRHPKDLLRTFAHEIIHHWQHEHEKLNHSDNKSGESDPKYAQNNPWLRQMEKQAYLLGNILFRDWEDEKKNSGRKSGKKGI